MRMGIAGIRGLPWLVFAAVIQGCGDLPLQYARLDESQVIDPAVIADIEAQRATRDDVVARLGTPYYSDTLGVAYVRCAVAQGKEVTVVFFIPVWVGPTELRECELTGIWFDSDGRTNRALGIRRRSDRLPEVSEWLSNPAAALAGEPGLLQTTPSTH